MHVFKKSFKALGTKILILVADKNVEESEKISKILEAIRKLYWEKEKIFSRFDKKSELNLLNRQRGKFRKVSADMLIVARKSLEYNAESQGLFDPRVLEILENIGYKNNFPENDFKTAAAELKSFSPLAEDLKIKGEMVRFSRRLDFSGIAKGYITDKAAEFLAKQGLENFLIDSGGDICAQGLDEKKERWKIGIEGFPEEKIMLEISNEAVATSGITRKKWENGGQKFHHLINPLNFERFDFDLKSVTVISQNTTDADVLAKVLFLMGKKRGMEFSNRKKIQSLFLDYKSNLYLSEEAKRYLT